MKTNADIQKTMEKYTIKGMQKVYDSLIPFYCELSIKENDLAEDMKKILQGLNYEIEEKTKELELLIDKNITVNSKEDELIQKIKIYINNILDRRTLNDKVRERTLDIQDAIDELIDI